MYYGIFFKSHISNTDEDLVPVLVGVCEVETRVVDAVLGRDQPVLGDHGGSAAPASDLYSSQVTIYFRAANEPLRRLKFHNHGEGPY